jgi:peptidoglycan/LPS O-acetylase OafA/YrhL
MNTRASTYRPDIDGLRALAIIPVVAFHAFPDWVRGGFVGVDVFFVISGYLISLIIFERLAAGTFTFTWFYARRIRRIFPALAIVLLACIAWGWFRLYGDDYSQLGKHAAGGAGFVANLLLWSEAGYFDAVSETKPLLHLWSLGIEEQFYLLWPGLLYVTWRARLNPLALIAAVFAASFLLNVVQVRTDEVSAFYSPLTRLWELLLGAGLAYLVLARGRDAHEAHRLDRWIERGWTAYTPWLRNLTAAAGLVCIAAAVFFFSADTSFPGWRAALPTGGALLLIASGPTAFVNRRLLSSRVLVWVGLISYPLYLWHWPLLSFATLATGTPPVAARAALVALSVAAAWVTYALIERPIRFTWKGWLPVAAASTLMLIAGVAGYAVYAAEGFQDRAINRSDAAHFLAYYERLRTRGLAEAYRAECDFMDWKTEAARPAIDPACTAAGERGTVFLWGDSHAQALSLGIRDVLAGGVNLAQVATSACPPRLDEQDPLALGGRCTRANAFARDRIAALKPDLVVLAQIFGHEQTDWIALARELRERGAKRVLLVGPAPQWSPGLPLLIVTHFWGEPFERVKLGLAQDVFATDDTLRRRLHGARDLDFVSLVDALCNDAGCLATVPGTDHQLLTIDRGHFSPAGSRYVGRTVLLPFLPATARR